MDHYFMTDRGQKRERNEDAGGVFYNQAMQSLAIVADGMGGHQAGEVASQLSVSMINEKWHTTAEIKSPLEAEAWVAEAFAEINTKIFKKSQSKDEYKGMGTTVVLAICLEDAIVIGHVGDSRVYMKHEAAFRQITADHSLVNELLKAGEISVAELKDHPQKNVLVRAVGTDDTVTVDIITKAWQKEDAILLCTDGLSNKISNEELEYYFNHISDYQDLAKELIHVANERGGEDNITMIIIRHNGKLEMSDSPC